MIVSVEDPSFTERERATLRFLEKFNLDHHAISDADFLALAEVLTIAEIVELGQICATFIGAHRWTHALDILGDGEPVLHYEPAQVNASSSLQAT
jgi:alkylhydroperoxidase family enzyme